MADAHGGAPKAPLYGVAQKIGHSIHDSGYHTSARPFVIAFIAINFVFLIFDPAQTLRNWVLLGYFAPLWAPILLANAAWHQWVRARRAEFIASQEHIL